MRDGKPLRSMPPVARPFPFGSLPRLTLRDSVFLRAVLRRLGPARNRATPLDDAWTQLLGATLTLAPEAPTVSPRAELLARLAGVSLCAVLEHPRMGVVLLACDRPFALRLAQRALGPRDDASVTHAPHGTLDPVWEGALTAIISRSAVSYWCDEPGPVVRAVTDDIADAFGALPSGESVGAWPATLGFDGVVGRATAVFALGVLLKAPPSPRRARIDALPVVASLVAGRARWTSAEFATLATGEVLALDGLHFRDHALAGRATLALGASPTLTCDVTLSATDAVTLTSSLEPVMMDAPDDDTRLDALPVEVTVEIARGQFTVGEVSSWQRGEVVRFDVALGDAVTVRGGGRAFARGELVDVEGHVGVRVTEIL